MTSFFRSHAVRAFVFAIGCGSASTALAQADAVDVVANNDAAPFSFAVITSDTTIDPERTAASLRAIDGSAVRFVVHAERSLPSSSSCSDVAHDARRAIIDASRKPVVPIVAASEWADCGDAGVEPFERLQRVGDTLFASDRSLGQARMAWSRQSATPRFRRYRENVRWQWGRVLFATVNLPNNNNDFRIGAGRNGEFEERVVANRAWLERTFRIASERRLSGIVLFVDAAPRFSLPLRVPDSRFQERDGYYEWKVALRDFVAGFGGRVLLVQARDPAGVTRPAGIDRPMRDVAGRPIENLMRISVPAGANDPMWLRIDVNPAGPSLFHGTIERVFDDPSGELYGRGPPR